MSILKKTGPLLLVLTLVIILLLVVFRDKISHNTAQQNISETMMNTEAQYIMPMVKLTQNMKRITGKTSDMLNAVKADKQRWENQQLMLRSMDSMASNMREMMDQMNAMTSNQNLMNSAEIQEKMNTLKTQLEIMQKSFEKFVLTVDSIQSEIQSEQM